MDSKRTKKVAPLLPAEDRMRHIKLQSVLKTRSVLQSTCSICWFLTVINVTTQLRVTTCDSNMSSLRKREELVL